MFRVRKKVVFIHQDQCCTSPLLEGLQAVCALGIILPHSTFMAFVKVKYFSVTESLS